MDELNERIILVCESVFENAKELENVGIQIMFMCMNKVLVSRYKKIRFPIVSFNELRKLIRLDWE